MLKKLPVVLNRGEREDALPGVVARCAENLRQQAYETGGRERKHITHCISRAFEDLVVELKKENQR